MRGRVLFLDDSALIRAAASRALSKRGVPFETACSIREAFKVRHQDLSAALLDIELEDGEGTAVAAWLRESAPALPIAFLTGGAEDVTLRRAVQYGPVFAKSEVERAITWAASHALAAASGPPAALAAEPLADAGGISPEGPQAPEASKASKAWEAAE